MLEIMMQAEGWSWRESVLETAHRTCPASDVVHVISKPIGALLCRSISQKLGHDKSFWWNLVSSG